MTNPDSKITILLIVKSINFKLDNAINVLLRRYSNDVYEIPNIAFRPFEQDKGYDQFDFIETLLYKTTKLPLLKNGKGFIPVQLVNFVAKNGKILLVYSCFVPSDINVTGDFKWININGLKNLNFDDDYLELLMKENNGII